jgi:hypothetical protein
VFCFQRGSAESKDPDSRDEVDEDPRPDVPTSTLDFTFLIRYIRCLTSIDMLALDCGGHHDVATAQTSQRLSRRLPEPATRKSVS